MMTLPCAAAIVGVGPKGRLASLHKPMKIEIRRAEPGDYKAVQQVHATPKSLAGTLQLPFPSEEMWKKRLEEMDEQTYALVACVDGELVAMAGLSLFTKAPRRRHVGYVGLAGHDKGHAKGGGSAVMQALVAVAGNWLNLAGLDVHGFGEHAPALGPYK